MATRLNPKKLKRNIPKKYLTESDKIFKRVNSAYAKYYYEKHMEYAWTNEHKKNVLSTLPKRLAQNFESYNFDSVSKKEIQSLFIYGEAGNGKTVISAYYYLDFIHSLYLKRGVFNSITYDFVIFPQFIETIQRQIGNKEHAAQTDFIKKYSQCDILVLDDFGIKKITEYVYSVMYLIINERYLNLLPTIINGNESLKELGTKFADDRIIRRIDEDYLLIKKQKI